MELLSISGLLNELQTQQCFDDRPHIQKHTWSASEAGWRPVLQGTADNDIYIGSTTVWICAFRDSRADTIVPCSHLFTARQQPVTRRPAGHCVRQHLVLFPWVN